MPTLRVALAVLAAALLLLAGTIRPALAIDTTPQISEAREAIIIDANGEVLWEHNAHERMALASITKVMTAIVALDSDVPLDQQISVSAIGLPEGAQTAELEDGEQMSFEKLLELTLIYSANDAAINVGIAVSGSEEAFVELMNAKAAELGLKDTHFKNTHGLEDPDHYSSAYDVAMMGRYAMQNYPDIARIVQMGSTSIKREDTDVVFETTDRFVREYYGALGVKTGSTESGATFCGAAQRLGVRLYSCVLGCKTSEGRWDDTYALFDWAYEQYGRHVLADSSLVVRHPHFAFHFGQRLNVRCERDLVCGIWPEDGHSYERVMTQPNVLCTPGMPYGGVSFAQNDRQLGARVLECGHELVSIPSFGPFNTMLFTGELLPPESPEAA